MAFLSSISLRRRERSRSSGTRSRRPSHVRHAAALRDRARLEAPTQDRETFNCACGFVFKAEPTTGVGCPHCGTAQAW